MRAVVVLAIVGAVGLVLAALTGSTPLAVVVVALALAGIVQLTRDWRRHPPPDPGRDAGQGGPLTVQPLRAPGSRLSADEFLPDISTDPDGPSSDARAD